MKKILFIYLLTMVFITAYAQESSSKRLGFGIYGGIQLPDDVNLDTGPWALVLSLIFQQDWAGVYSLNIISGNLMKMGLIKL